MTNRLDNMERRGVIRRIDDPDDRRGVIVELTDEGRRLWDEAVGAQAREGGRRRVRVDARERAAAQRPAPPADARLRGRARPDAARHELASRRPGRLSWPDVNVTLPDGSALELPEGASALDAARAIGPKLAEQAVLARVDGEPRDLRLPLPDGASLEILTTRDHDDPDALYVLRHSAAHLLAEAVAPAPPGREGRDRPADRERLLLRLRVPRADPRGGSRRDRGGGAARARRGPCVGRGRRSSRDEARARFEAEGEPYKVELVDTRRGRHHALHAGRLHRSLPRPAPAGLEADQGVQADRPRRRLLARRRAATPS